MPNPLPALRSSVDRLAYLVRPLDEATIGEKAYPSEWTIADVLSHLGSGAVIMQRSLDDGLTGATKPDDFNKGVWDEWNAKSPRAQVDDSLAADAQLTAQLEAVASEDRARFRSSLGPFELDWDSFVGLRLSEHLLHEWDVDVTLNPAATVGADGTTFVVDNLGFVARFAARPSGEPTTITIATTDPERTFAVVVGTDAATLTSTDLVEQPHLSMPAESFVRVVYGRLDPDHTPASVTGNASLLDQLRGVFPGF
jgi:uncharacterized protein (TIGR03083 family)